MRRIIEGNLLRTFKKIYFFSDTYNSGLIFRKVSAIYSSKRTTRITVREKYWAGVH
jgi:hypothetical protein